MGSHLGKTDVEIDFKKIDWLYYCSTDEASSCGTVTLWHIQQQEQPQAQLLTPNRNQGNVRRVFGLSSG